MLTKWLWTCLLGCGPYLAFWPHLPAALAMCSPRGPAGAMLNWGQRRSVGDTVIILTACHPVPCLNVYIYICITYEASVSTSIAKRPSYPTLVL